MQNLSIIYVKNKYKKVNNNCIAGSGNTAGTDTSKTKIVLPLIKISPVQIKHLTHTTYCGYNR